MRVGGGLISTGFTFSAIDGVLRLLMDDPPTEIEDEEFEEESFESSGQAGPDDGSAASVDPRTRFGRVRDTTGES